MVFRLLTAYHGKRRAYTALSRRSRGAKRGGGCACWLALARACSCLLVLACAYSCLLLPPPASRANPRTSLERDIEHVYGVWRERFLKGSARCRRGFSFAQRLSSRGVRVFVVAR